MDEPAAEAIDMGTTSEASETSGLLRVSALIGAVAWLAHRLLTDADLITSTLVMAIAVVVPLGLSLWSARPKESAWFGWLSLLQPFAAVGAITALSLEPRPASALFAVPWLAFTLGMLVVGVRRLQTREAARDWPAALACLLLPIGASWLCLSRAGLDPFDVGGLLVLLGAVHFHFAAFGALLLVACSTARLEQLVKAERAPAKLLRVSSVATTLIVVGTFLVAAGIAALAWVGIVGALAMTLGLFAYTVLTLGFVFRHQRSLWSKILLLVVGVSILMSMPLALLWAWGQWTQTPVVGMSSMLRLHGMANAHGFVLSGLLAWWFEQRAQLSSGAKLLQV